MRIHRIVITWSISERQAADMPEVELDKLVEQLDIIVKRLQQYATDNTPEGLTIGVD